MPFTYYDDYCNDFSTGSQMFDPYMICRFDLGHGLKKNNNNNNIAKDSQDNMFKKGSPVIHFPLKCY